MAYFPIQEKTELVEQLLDLGVLDQGKRVSKQPGRCCVKGCETPVNMTESN
jgi:4-hydroxybutyryl-CoA dehydratase/vinylacetyl-CoA-Delta-isomerase